MRTTRWANQYGSNGVNPNKRITSAVVQPSLDIDLVRQAGLPPTWDGHGDFGEWEMVAKSSDAGIRMRTAAHPDCPTPLVALLAQDHNQWVAQQAVSQPAGNTQVLEHGAAHAHPLVRLAVIQHPVCPPSLGKRLLNDPDIEVRRAAVDRWGKGQ